VFFAPHFSIIFDLIFSDLRLFGCRVPMRVWRCFFSGQPLAVLFFFAPLFARFGGH